MIDVNVSLSRWPFRRLPDDETSRLVSRLKQGGVVKACAGNFDALLHHDIAAANSWLVEECRRAGKEMLLPFGCVNPMLPDWQEDLRRCHEEHAMRGIRLHPDYHGYRLDQPECVELLKRASERSLIVQIAVMMEDERTQHPLVQVPAADTSPLVDLLAEVPDLHVILLNSQRALQAEALSKLASAGQVFFDIAMQESVGGITKLMELVPHERILFGSFAPLFYFESAQLKLQESDLGETIRHAIATGNATSLLARE